MIETVLPVVFLLIMGLALFMYVILDGFDLGVGLLLPLASDDDKDMMIATIGPFWDANETWIVLGVGVLLIAFPEAYGDILTRLYLPVTIMLMGLILRGVAFDFRVKAGIDKKSMWNRIFFAGSLIASIAQGWMLGHYIAGLSFDATNYIFAAVTALAFPALYLMLGAAWLLIKTEGELFMRALGWARRSFWPMFVAFVIITLVTPVVNDSIVARWLANFFWILPLPLISLLALLRIRQLLASGEALERKPWPVYFYTVLLCLMATLGLAYSIFPDIIVGQMTIWEATAPSETLIVVLIGVALTLPLILAYTLWVHRIFRGKATQLSYD